jgi:hypothetical protein
MNEAMQIKLLLLASLGGVLLNTGCSSAGWNSGSGSAFHYDAAALPDAKPWTSKEFAANPEDFQFVIIGDRTGGANAQGTFKLAMGQLNLLRPEFVINVGDTIEGYSDDKAMADLKMPFFRTPGNHDIANQTAQEVWRERHGATYYHFVYKNVLFMILDSEDPPREAPEGIKEKIGLYNKLQTEDPAKAQAMLAEFMSDEAVIAALSRPVEFTGRQLEWIRKTLADHPDVRWTFLFQHEPAWENPSESFKVIQEMLKDRKHTYLAGHLHYYDYDLIDGHEHITMGPAGASFHQEGPGNVDHIMWVTMTEDGPEMGNIALKGVFDRKGLDPSLFGAYDRKGADTGDPSKEEQSQ